MYYSSVPASSSGIVCACVWQQSLIQTVDMIQNILHVEEFGTGEVALRYYRYYLLSASIPKLIVSRRTKRFSKSFTILSAPLLHAIRIKRYTFNTFIW